MSVLDEMKSAIGLYAEGYAVVNDGVLVQESSHPTKRLAAGQFLTALNLINPFEIITMICSDPDCDCIDRVLKERAPSARVVRVKVTVLD